MTDETSLDDTDSLGLPNMEPSHEPKMAEGPIREFSIVSEDEVLISGVYHGLELKVINSPTGSYELSVTSTPELEGNYNDYQIEADLEYAPNGRLRSYNSSTFIKGDHSDFINGSMTLAQRAAMAYAGFSGDVDSAVTDALAQREIDYYKATEEPNVTFTRQKDGTWKATLNPTTTSQIRLRHALGSITPNSDDSVTVMSGADSSRALHYAIRELPGSNGSTMLDFITYTDVDVFTDEGIKQIRLQKSVTVPEQVDLEAMERIFDKEDRSFETMGQWFPITVIKPVY